MHISRHAGSHRGHPREHPRGTRVHRTPAFGLRRSTSSGSLRSHREPDPTEPDPRAAGGGSSHRLTARCNPQSPGGSIARLQWRLVPRFLHRRAARRSLVPRSLLLARRLPRSRVIVQLMLFGRARGPPQSAGPRCLSRRMARASVAVWLARQSPAGLGEKDSLPLALKIINSKLCYGMLS